MINIRWNIRRPRLSRSQVKRRRNLIIAVHKLGYITKSEFKPHLEAINRAVRAKVAYKMPLYNQAKVARRLPKPKPEPQREEYWRYPGSNRRPYGW